jgi:hypothetical protein
MCFSLTKDEFERRGMWIGMTACEYRDYGRRVVPPGVQDDFTLDGYQATPDTMMLQWTAPLRKYPFQPGSVYSVYSIGATHTRYYWTIKP